jgi:hypothetical protein
MEILSKILSNKQHKYNNIPYHQYLSNQNKCIPLSIKIPMFFKNMLKDELPIINEVSSIDSFIHSILLIFNNRYSTSNWLTKIEMVAIIKDSLTSSTDNIIIKQDILNGRLFSNKCIQFISDYFQFNTLIVKRGCTDNIISSSANMTLILLESDREIYYPISIDDKFIFTRSSYDFRNNI